MTRLVVALGALAIVVGVVVSLSTPGRALLGTNGLTQNEFVQVLRPHRSFCQAGETLPAHTGRVRLRIGTYGSPGPDLTLRFSSHGKLMTQGTLAAGWTQGDTEVPIRPLDSVRSPVQMCVENGGSGRLAIAGNSGSLRTAYLAGDRQTWWTRFGQVRERFSQGKSSWYGGLSLPITLLLVAAAAVLAAVLLTRRPS